MGSIVDLPKIPIRPPFANYDIVVYFGCGLFSLPFIQRYYLTPFGVRIPSFKLNVDLPFSNVVITTLILLFSVYVLGHIIAFVSSQFIEKPMESVFGKTSSIILKASRSVEGASGTIIAKQIKESLRESWKRNTTSSVVARVVFHAPVIIPYVFAYKLRIFGFYVSRIPLPVFTALEKNVRKLDLSDLAISNNSSWFKVIESYVVNNYPTPSARRYNHRVISGLFRSMCIIFLVSIWCELIYGTSSKLSSWSVADQLMASSPNLPSWGWRIAILITVYCFSLYGYLKYQRRCVEEAILAFALTRVG
jgi:hypothetical protein